METIVEVVRLPAVSLPNQKSTRHQPSESVNKKGISTHSHTAAKPQPPETRAIGMWFGYPMLDFALPRSNLLGSLAPLCVDMIVAVREAFSMPSRLLVGLKDLLLALYPVCLLLLSLMLFMLPDWFLPEVGCSSLVLGGCETSLKF